MNFSHRAKGLGSLASSTVIAQVILIIAAPLLTRLYSPEEFGALSVFVSLSLVLSVLFSLRYEMAVMVPSSNNESEQLSLVSLVVSSIGAFGALVAIWVWGGDISSITGLSQSLLYFLPLSAFFIAVNKTVVMLALKSKKYGPVSVSRVFQSIGTVVPQTALSVFWGGGLILGHIIGFLVSTYLLRNFFISALTRRFRLSNIWQLACEYKNFPLYSTWGALLSVLGGHFPPVVYGYYFGFEFVGLYALSHRIVAAPISVLGEAVSKFFLAESAGGGESHALGERIFKTHQVLLEISIPFFLGLYIFGEAFFGYVFGVEWGRAGEIVIVMIPWMLMVFTVSPLSSVYEITGMQHVGLIFNVTMFIGRMIILIWGGGNWDSLKTVEVFSLYSAILWIGMLVWIYARYVKAFHDALKLYIRSAFFCFVIFMPSLFFRMDILPYYYFLVVQISVILLYGAMIIKMRIVK